MPLRRCGASCALGHFASQVLHKPPPPATLFRHTPLFKQERRFLARRCVQGNPSLAQGLGLVAKTPAVQPRLGQTPSRRLQRVGTGCYVHADSPTLRRVVTEGLCQPSETLLKWNQPIKLNAEFRAGFALGVLGQALPSSPLLARRGPDGCCLPPLQHLQFSVGACA